MMNIDYSNFAIAESISNSMYIYKNIFSAYCCGQSSVASVAGEEHLQNEVHINQNYVRRGPSNA